jgi:hypothetical protein
MLSETQTYHADGTFYTATQFFQQLYVIHAYFHPKAT